MAWLKIDDGFPEHERIDPLGDKAFRLHVTALCLCARKLTDGYLSTKDVRTCVSRVGTRTGSVAELEAAGLWVRNGSGWQVRDYLDYNPAAEEVREQRAKAAQRMRDIRKGGKRK